MGLTENQGGSDLRTNTTRAEPAGGGFRLHGHKWFLSVPMCDAFLVLAQSPKGLSCFFMPRWTPDGERNALRINRLKDKLGNKSNASSEVEFDGAYAQLVGEEGRGIPIMIEMAGYTRLDCCIGSSSLMRQAVVQAVHQRLIDELLLEGRAMARVMHRLRHRLAHQRRRTDAAIEPRIAPHLDDGRDAAPLLAD